MLFASTAGNCSQSPPTTSLTPPQSRGSPAASDANSWSCRPIVTCLSVTPSTYKAAVLISSMKSQRRHAVLLCICAPPVCLLVFLSLAAVFSLSTGTSPQEWMVAPSMRPAMRFCEAMHWYSTPLVQPSTSLKYAHATLMHFVFPVPGGARSANASGRCWRPR